MSNIGTRIRSKRVAAKLTAKELSEKAGVPEKTIYRIETGEVQDPKISSIAPLTKPLNCTLDELVLGLEQQTLVEQFRAHLIKFIHLGEFHQQKVLDAVDLMMLGCGLERHIAHAFKEGRIEKITEEEIGVICKEDPENDPTGT